MLGIEDGDSLEIFVEGKQIILEKYTPGCEFCGRIENTHNLCGKLICPDCAHKAMESIKKAGL